MRRDELEQELFIAMLDLSRRGAGPVFELVSLCEHIGINAEPADLLAFNTDNDGTFGSKSLTTMKQIRFEISAAGIRHAKEIEASRRKPSINERVNALPIGKGVWDLIKIGIGAVIGVLAANYFGT